MKFFLQILFILVIGYVAGILLPWWSIAITAFIAGLIFNTKANFAAGMLGIGLLWIVKALAADSLSNVDLADRVAQILQVQQKPFLYLLMFILSGLIGGFAAMAGGALRKSKKRKLYY